MSSRDFGKGAGGSRGGTRTSDSSNASAFAILKSNCVLITYPTLSSSLRAIASRQCQSSSMRRFKSSVWFESPPHTAGQVCQRPRLGLEGSVGTDHGARRMQGLADPTVQGKSLLLVALKTEPLRSIQDVPNRLGGGRRKA